MPSAFLAAHLSMLPGMKKRRGHIGMNTAGDQLAEQSPGSSTFRNATASTTNMSLILTHLQRRKGARKLTLTKLQ